MMGDSRMRVTVLPAPGWRCERCRKVLPEVGLCDEHPDLCLRCLAVMTGEEPDVHGMAARRFDRFLREEMAAGHPKPEAVRRAGHRNAGRNPDGSVAWPGRASGGRGAPGRACGSAAP